MSSLVKRGGFWQRLLFLIARLFVRPVSQDQSPRRIALLRFDKRLGEVLLQTPLFAALRQARPDVEIIAVTHPALCPLLQNQPHVDQVLPLSMRGFPFAPSAWRMLLGLRSLRVDCAIDCGNYEVLSTSQALATLISGAPCRVGFDRGGAAARQIYSQTVEPGDDEPSERHQRLRLLTAMNIQCDLETSMLYVPGASHSPEIHKLLEEMRHEDYALINPGGRLAWRRVGVDVFAAAGQKLLQSGLRPLVVWGPGERELAMKLCMHIGAHARLAPPSSVDELAALMAASKAVVSNNSGPMHLALAVNTPTLGVFLDMPSARWGDNRPPHAIVDLSGRQDPKSDLEQAVAVFLATLNELAAQPKG